MSTRLASTRAADRTQARRLVVTSAADAEARRPAAPRARPTLLCQWRVDEATGRPVCRWILQPVTTESSASAPASSLRIADSADRDLAPRRGGPIGEAAAPTRAWQAAITPTASRKGAA